MASLFSKALVYLGLVDEDEDEDVVLPVEQPAPAPVRPESEGRRIEPPASASRTTARSESRFREGVAVRTSRPSPAPRSAAGPPDDTVRSRGPVGPEDAARSEDAGAVRPLTTEARADILVIEEFGDARILADRVRERTPVVCDFRRCDADLVRRVVDFSSGLIYALNGTMTKVGESLVLVLPAHVTLGDDEKRRLASLGAYELH